MVAGTFLLSMIVLFERIFISVAKEPVQNALFLSDKQMGWVLSIFALGYALFQTPSGILADRFGPRRVLTFVVSVWSLFTALTGIAWNFISLLVIRFVFGLGEAGAFPSIARAIYSWIPVRERGIVNGINFSGGRIGAAVALPLIAWLIDLAGWRLSFVFLGMVGFIWALFWFLWFRDNPEDHKDVSEKEKAIILEFRQKQEEKTDIPKISLHGMLKSQNIWLLMLQYFSSNFTFFFCLTWLFPHLKAQFHLDNLEAGFYSSVPLICGALGNWTSGILVDFLYRKKLFSLSRKLPAIIGFALASVGLVAGVYMDNVTYAVIFLSIAVFGADMTLSPSWSVCVDIGKENSGAVSGTMNMAGNLGSFLTALAFPYLKDMTGSVTPFFFVGAGLNLLALFMWLQIKPDKQLKQ
jgi:MFS transporter, ACS family, glucarate transporter